MKKQIKRIGALVLAGVLALGMSVSALAATTLDANGEQGVFTDKDKPVSQTKTLKLDKELKAYNFNESSIQAPTISYTYTIEPATVAAGTTVTDSDKSGTIHDTGVTVTVPVKAGVGTPTISNSGVVAWSASEAITASTNGASNKKDIEIDFSSVKFEGPGVYRYVINETLTSGTYAAAGVTETKTGSSAASHSRYIDVYVRPAQSGYSDGSTADQWDIYGFTCFYNNTSITEADKTTNAVKTTGFVSGTTNGTAAVSADSYYTFNVTISKTVVNDGYGAATVEFPFTVLFTNSKVSAGTIVTNGATAPTGTDFTHNTAVNLSSGALKGIAKLKSGQQIKYVGIPNGTSVEVYETNVATGVTYKVDTALTTNTTTTTTDAAVISGTAPTEATAQAATKADKESTKATFTTTADEDTDNPFTVAITNTLVTISPTGVSLRFAPYAVILAAGLALLFVSRRRRVDEEE